LYNKELGLKKDKEVSMETIKEAATGMAPACSVDGAWVVWGEAKPNQDKNNPKSAASKKRKSGEEDEIVVDGVDGRTKKKEKKEGGNEGGVFKEAKPLKRYDDAGAHKVFVSNLDTDCDWKV